LWVLAVLSHWTVVHRVYHTWREMRGPDRAAVEAARLNREKAHEDNLVRADYSVQN
jgi:hypothetical protein